MIIEDLLKYLVRNKKITVSKMSEFKISFDNIAEICKEFNWTIQNVNNILTFVDENGKTIEDFSNFKITESKYRKIVVLLKSYEDCKKLQEVFPCLLKYTIDNHTTQIFINDLDNGFALNSKRKFDGYDENEGINQITHSEKSWEYFDNWRDMPEYYFSFKKDIYVKIELNIDKNNFSEERLSELLQNKITKKTDSIWFPPKEKNEFNYYRVLGGEDPKFPIFVISKGRSDVYKYHTSQSLSRMKIHHYLCVEPQEIEAYSKSKLNDFEYCHIIEMDMEYKKNFDPLSDIGTTENHGPGPARNFCGDYARKLGAKWCWILDDNTEDFYRVWRGRRIISFSPETFRSCERFVERYENIAIAGLQYHMFVINQDPRPPFVTNTRIFSYHLWNLEAFDKLGVRQRGRYNDDVILSLDLLTKGWCSVQFNCYIARKLRTQILKGGCTTDIYQEKFGGTFAKSQQLCEVYPQYTSLVWKFNRWHHEVNYNGFKQHLKIKPEYENLLKDDYNKINEHGAYIVKIDPKYHLDPDLDNREFLEKTYPKGCPEDITQDLMYLPDDRNNIELRNFWDFEKPGQQLIFKNVKYSATNDILESSLFDENTTIDPVSVDRNNQIKMQTYNANANVENINNEINSMRNSVEFSIDNL